LHFYGGTSAVIFKFDLEFLDHYSPFHGTIFNHRLATCGPPIFSEIIFVGNAGNPSRIVNGEVPVVKCLMETG